MLGTVIVTDKGNVKVHTYMSPADSFNVTTQLIETPTAIVAVDAQFVLGYAAEVVAYAEELGKPIERLIITHAHPDHYQGAKLFGAPIHALDVVTKQIVEGGDKSDPTGEVIPVADFTPTETIEPGTAIIDGVTFEFDAISGGEAADQLLIKLPELGVLVAQDLVYHDNHLFLGQNDIAGWQQILGDLQALDGYDVVLAGHGAPSDPSVYTKVATYLDAAAELLGDDGDAYKAAITAKFPEYGADFLIDIANLYLFGTPPPMPEA